MIGVNCARKHIGWYTKGLHGSAEFRNAFNQQADPKRARRRCSREFYAPWLSKAPPPERRLRPIRRGRTRSLTPYYCVLYATLLC